jgi:lipopolysaccharide biosynthesis glycosyltransferase
MNPVVIALASNERYFQGLYCAVASALGHMATGSVVDVHVLDGGISQSSKNILSRLAERFGQSVRVEFVPVDDSVFRGATLGPHKSHMAYCRILLPRVLSASRVVYLDCDVLVFRDLSDLFERPLSSGKILAAVRDSETLSLGDDSRIVADAMKLPTQGAYFNSGVMLMNLDELRKQNFLERSLEFFKNWRGHYRFWDQSAFNFLLYGRIDELPEYWNRASWQFDEQEENDLGCVLHYTGLVPWLRERPGPAQALFERFAEHAGLAVNRRTAEFKHSQHQWFWRNALAPLRAAAFFVQSILYKIFGRWKKAADYQRAARYWFNYLRNVPGRRRVYGRRIAEIHNMKFDAARSETYP